MTVAQEWLELERRMNIYIRINTEERWMRPLGIGRTPLVSDNYEVMKSYLHDIFDLDAARHKFVYEGFRPESCEIGSQPKESNSTLEDRICEFVEQNVLNLYDPCVQLRIWNAYHLQDRQFLRQLGKAISSSIKRRQPTNNYLYILRNFLMLLHENDIVDLVDGAESDWEKAFQIIENLRRKASPLRNLKTAVKHLRGPKLFKDNCKKWFA